MDKQFYMWITQGIRDLSVNLSEFQLEQFYRYYELLTEWNRVMNLTSITEMRAVICKHFIDSLSIIKIVPDLKKNSSRRLLDLGSGAGLPGVPLKIAFPDLKITLLDSLNKRIRFLNEVICELGLSHIEAVHGRAEDFGKDPSFRESYDLCVSRAVANLSTLSEYCLPFVRREGLFVSYKSGAVRMELEQAGKAVRILGGSIEKTVYFQLPGTEENRSLILIRKIRNTPAGYPRKAGLPGKEPLT